MTYNCEEIRSLLRDLPAEMKLQPWEGLWHGDGKNYDKFQGVNN